MQTTHVHSQEEVVCRTLTIHSFTPLCVHQHTRVKQRSQGKGCRQGRNLAPLRAAGRVFHDGDTPELFMIGGLSIKALHVRLVLVGDKVPPPFPFRMFFFCGKLCSWKETRKRWQARRSARWQNQALTSCTTQSSTHSAGARLAAKMLFSAQCRHTPADTGVLMMCTEWLGLCACDCLQLVRIPLVSVSLIACISLPLFLPRTALQERTRRMTWVIPNPVCAKTAIRVCLSSCEFGTC